MLQNRCSQKQITKHYGSWAMPSTSCQLLNILNNRWHYRTMVRCFTGQRKPILLLLKALTPFSTDSSQHWLSIYYIPGTVLEVICIFNISHEAPEYYYYCFYTDEKIEAQRSETHHPKLYSWEAVQVEFEHPSAELRDWMPKALLETRRLLILLFIVPVRNLFFSSVLPN